MGQLMLTNGQTEALDCAFLPDHVVTKVDECIVWMGKAKDLARRVMSLQSTSSAARKVKEDLEQKLQEMLQKGVALETCRVTGWGSLVVVKESLAVVSRLLVELQELCRAVQAMG